MSLTIACVLRGGGDYTKLWVWALKRGLLRHMKTRYRTPLAEPEPDTWTLRCLTDRPRDPLDIPLEHDWGGWWAKMELFRPGLFSGPVLYIDLDTVVVGDLGVFGAYSGDLALLSDFYRPRLGQSGVMLFNPGTATETLWGKWLAQADTAMRRYRGDGEWLHANADSPDRIQDVYPHCAVSFEVHAQGGPPPGSRLVCFHGRLKQDSPEAGWAHREWRSLDRGAA